MTAFTSLGFEHWLVFHTYTLCACVCMCVYARTCVFVCVCVCIVVKNCTAHDNYVYSLHHDCFTSLQTTLQSFTKGLDMLPLYRYTQNNIFEYLRSWPQLVCMYACLASSC